MTTAKPYEPSEIELLLPWYAAGTLGREESRQVEAALAADPERSRWNQKSVNSGQLAREYGFTDLDGSQPDIWRYIEEIREPGLQANLNDYR